MGDYISREAAIKKIREAEKQRVETEKRKKCEEK